MIAATIILTIPRGFSPPSVIVASSSILMIPIRFRSFVAFPKNRVFARRRVSRLDRRCTLDRRHQLIVYSLSAMTSLITLPVAAWPSPQHGHECLEIQNACSSVRAIFASIIPHPIEQTSFSMGHQQKLISCCRRYHRLNGKRSRWPRQKGKD